MCTRIKKELEKFGKKCWMDIDNMHGDTLDAMAKAIENSTCVLICMSEKYYNSDNCKFEAQYVIQQKKPFVPLLMQKGYKPTGW